MPVGYEGRYLVLSPTGLKKRFFEVSYRANAHLLDIPFNPHSRAMRAALNRLLNSIVLGTRGLLDNF